VLLSLFWGGSFWGIGGTIEGIVRKTLVVVVVVMVGWAIDRQMRGGGLPRISQMEMRSEEKIMNYDLRQCKQQT
jgi:hypothetical protein